jgi:hypothetical protein
LADYQLPPASLVRPVARFVPLLELAIAFALLVQPWLGRVERGQSVGAVCRCHWHQPVARTSRHRLCCAGPDQAQPLRPVLLLRNSVLVVLALLASVTPIARDMTLFDGFVTVAAAAVALLIYAAADGLLANSLFCSN